MKSKEIATLYKVLYINFQKESLRDRLEELQKEYDSLSQAHNSLEQLNSNWSERNMEQRNTIGTMQQEMDDLNNQRAQAAEEARSHLTALEQLKKTHLNEESGFIILIMHEKRIVFILILNVRYK